MAKGTVSAQGRSEGAARRKRLDDEMKERAVKPEKQARKHALTPEMEAAKWKPGQSGNPRGRPRKPACLTSILKAQMGEVCPLDQQGRTWGEVIAVATMELAVKGNATALKEVWERNDGKVSQTLNIDFDIDWSLVPTEILQAVADGKIDLDKLHPYAKDRADDGSGESPA